MSDDRAATTTPIDRPSDSPPSRLGASRLVAIGILCAGIGVLLLGASALWCAIDRGGDDHHRRMHVPRAMGSHWQRSFGMGERNRGWSQGSAQEHPADEPTDAPARRDQ